MLKLPHGKEIDEEEVVDGELCRRNRGAEKQTGNGKVRNCAHGKKAFRRFKDVLQMVDDELLKAGYRWKNEQLNEAVKEWFEELSEELGLEFGKVRFISASLGSVPVMRGGGEVAKAYDSKDGSHRN